MSRRATRNIQSGLRARDILQTQVFGPRVSNSRGGEAVEGNWVPLTDGSEPPNFITDGAGNLIYVWYAP